VPNRAAVRRNVNPGHTQRPVGAQAAIIAVDFWKNVSFFAILTLAGLQNVPSELYESAKIDGASKFQVMTQVILPLSWPGFLTTGLIVGLGVWNEFLIAVTFMHQPDLKPVATSLRAFQERFTRDWGLTNAASVIMLLPVLILFLLMQRRFIEGLTQGGMKM